ncbi:MAG: chitinase [Epulopiscium sp. Nuni2H_MBin003]|nr:MAG: chitinase [Epulopiscium sp. Nuni2H_MBin003]
MSNNIKDWSVVLTGHDNFLKRSLTTYKDTLLEHSINFVPIDAGEVAFYIVDPTNTVRAVVYQDGNNAVDVKELISVVNSFRENTRLSVNPICPNQHRIVGEYILGSPANVDPSLLDFIVYSFALINPDGTFTVYSTRHLQETVNLKKFNPNLKVIMAIGGWAAEGFSDAAFTAEARFKFAREAQKWVNEYDLDGIDLDWEYPGSSVAGIKSRPEDTQNFTLLLEALRMVLGNRAWISVAGIADSSYIRNVEIAKIAPFIDYFNVMTYDFTAGNSGASALKHQSNLYTSELSLNNISVDIYVQNLLKAGMPASKILIGLGFYGRQGMSFTKTFDQIRRDYLNKNGYVVKFDNVAKAPYIVDPNGNFFLSFDNELSIYYKGQFVIENCLGGLFSWQAAFDQANILSSAMNLAVNNPTELESILQSYYS